MRRQGRSRRRASRRVVWARFWFIGWVLCDGGGGVDAAGAAAAGGMRIPSLVQNS